MAKKNSNINLAVKIPTHLKTRLKLEATRRDCLTCELVIKALDQFLPKFEEILEPYNTDDNGAKTLREQFEEAVSS